MAPSRLDWAQAVGHNRLILVVALKERFVAGLRAAVDPQIDEAVLAKISVLIGRGIKIRIVRAIGCVVRFMIAVCAHVVGAALTLPLILIPTVL